MKSILRGMFLLSILQKYQIIPLNLILLNRYGTRKPELIYSKLVSKTFPTVQGILTWLAGAVFSKQNMLYPPLTFMASLDLVDDYHNSHILNNATVDLFRVEVNICKPHLLFEDEEESRGRDRILDDRGRALKAIKSISPEKRRSEGRNQSRSPIRSPQRSNSPRKNQEHELFSPTSRQSTMKQLADMEASFDAMDIAKFLSNYLEEEEVLKLTTLGGINDTVPLLCLTKKRLWELGVKQTDLVDGLIKGMSSTWILFLGHKR